MDEKSIRVGLFGYSKKQVLDHIRYIEEDYEGELAKKQDRMFDLIEENRQLKKQIEDLKNEIKNHKEQEIYISKALVKAEKKAQDIVEAGHKKAREVYYKMELEKAKWQERVKQIRGQMLDFERAVCETLEEFRAEVNYLTSKEVSEALLEDDNIVQDEIRSVS
ncbi:MAG: hypothetical protein GX974_06490 [Clostridiales bacterium]|nr:hypothetical protein [Clostridiales bacterium]